MATGMAAMWLLPWEAGVTPPVLAGVCGTSCQPNLGGSQGKESSGSVREKYRVSLSTKDPFFETLSAERGTLS